MVWKSRALFILLALAVVCVGGGAFLVTTNLTQGKAFEQSGYVIADKVENDESGYDSVQATFDAGVNYQTNYQNDKLTFVDSATNEKATVENYGFVHYADGSVAALKPGVLLDLSKLQPNDMSAFNIETGTHLSNSGSGFGIDHMGETILLDSVLWKLSASKMMIMGQDLSLQLSEGAPYNFNDFVEVDYIDDGVMQISDSNTTILTISPIAQLSVNNGPVVDLYNGVAVNDQAQLPLSNLLVGNSDNTDITQVEREALSAVTIPTFTVIQGVDGQSGTPGVGGERGSSGDNGASGSEGASGSSGVGSDVDENGAGGSQTKVEQFIKPVFELQSFSYNSVSVQGYVVILDDEGVLVDGSVIMRLVDAQTGITLIETPNVNAGMVGEGNPWPFGYEPLVPNKAYKLTISAQYRVPNSSGSDEIYTADFISKTIIADDVGLSLVKETITSDSIAVNLRKEDFSGATSAHIVLYDENGLLVDDQIVQPQAGDNFVQFNNLDPNSVYRVAVEQVTVTYSDGSTSTNTTIANYGDQLSIATLQNLAGATVAAPKVFGSNPNMTISAQPGAITAILANSIVNYRYEFWRADAVQTKPDLILNSSLNAPVLANVSPLSNNVNPSLLNWGTIYKVRLIVEVNDNEKVVEYASDYSDAVGLFGNHYPIVTYVPNDQSSPLTTQYDWALGVVSIDPNGGTITVDSTHQLDMVFESTTSQHKITVPFSDLSTLAPPQGIDTATDRRNPFVLPLNQNYLQENTAYRVTIYGFVDTDALSTTPPVKIAMDTFSIHTGIPNVVELHMRDTAADSGQPPAGHAFAVQLWLEDYTDTFQYEASNMAYIELELYFGRLQDGDTRAPNATAKINSTSLIPGKSTLGPNRADDMSYSGQGYAYSPDGTPPSFVDLSGGATPSGTPTGGVLITEGTFGLTGSQAAAATTLTLLVKSIADYTANAPTSYLFVNTFAIVNGEPDPIMRPSTSSKPHGVDIRTAQTAPPIPDNGAAFTTNIIHEVDRSGILNTMVGPGNTSLPSTPRPMYDPQTAVGLSAQSTFSAPELADTFTYTLWRTKTDYNDALIFREANASYLDETDSTNREKVLDVKLPVYKNGNVYQAPLLNVGFGQGTNVLPSGNQNGDMQNNNSAAYTVYLASIGSGTDVGQNQIAGYDSEDDGRGYHYYFTYTADLSKLADPNSGVSYIYPNDYSDGTSTNYSGVQLTSKRLSAPRQIPQFKFYPATSDTSQEIWNYRLNVLDDGVFVDSNGDPLAAGQVRLNNPPSGAGSPYTADLTVTPNATGLDYQPLIISPLYANTTFTLKYYQKLYQYTDIGADPSRYEQTLLNQYHRSLLTVADVESQYGGATLYSNPARNSLFVAYQQMSGTEMGSVAGIWVSVEPTNINSQATAWAGLLDIKLDTPDPNDSVTQYASVEIPMATLSAHNFVAGENIEVSTQVLFDSGKSGFDILSTATEGGFALQSQGPNASAAGTYQTPGSVVGSFAASSVASGGAYFLQADSTGGNSSGILTLDIGMPYNGKLNYESIIRPAFHGDLALDFTSLGSRIADTNNYITAKELLVTTRESMASTMPSIIPQISSYSASATADGADINFYLEGAAGVLDTPQNYHIKLYKAGSPGNPDVLVSDDWGGGFPADDQSTNSFTFTGLEPNSTYKFQVYGHFTTALDASVTPALPNTQAYYFYDTAQKAAGREYTFTTVANIIIGGDNALAFSADFWAQSYSNKFLQLKYSLSSTRGFKIAYTFVDNTNGGQTLVINSPAGYYTLNMEDNIPIGGQSGSYHDFFVPSHNYTVTINAVSNTGSTQLGSLGPVNFTLRTLVEPTFIVTATPSWNKDATPDPRSEIAITVAVNDPDWTIINSNYYLGVVQQNSTLPTDFSLKQTTPAVGTYIEASNIVPNSVYNVSVYAGVNLQNVFPTPPALVMPNNVDDPALPSFLQRAVNVIAVDANTVSAGDINARILTNGTTQLTFDNSINLNNGTAPYIQYSITSITNGTVLSTRTTAFNPVEVGSGAAAYKTFDLPGSQITLSGKYFIEYRLLDSSYNVLPGTGCSGTIMVIK
ncbi:MAG: hypothetical protein LBC35_04805 [Coriobacteriales bacterium]|jgi:hypothetical protein|nr:hypothetical protein [Coriobacteriales bacterium]